MRDVLEALVATFFAIIDFALAAPAAAIATASVVGVAVVAMLVAIA